MCFLRFFDFNSAVQCESSDGNRLGLSFRDKDKRRRGRVFQVIMSGLTRGVHFHRRFRVLHLTSHVGYDMGRLSKDFQILRKRVEHEFGFSIQYVKVDTAEGNGVVHCIYFPVGLKGQAVGWSVGFIPQSWLSDAWCDITGGSSVCWITQLSSRKGIKRLANYLVSQYFSGQSGLERVSYSWEWFFRGFRRLWCKVFAKYYFLDKVRCLIDWNLILCSELSFIYRRFREFFVGLLPKYRRFF